ncbi:MAG: hypothetical protein AB1351_13065, partial [Thermoproteota archaeon]
SDNRDKSLHGLMVALVMAGAIGGSVILFAYASTNESATAAGEVLPELVITEKVVEKPVYIERIKYVNQTIEVEKPVYVYVNETDDSSKPDEESKEQEEEKEKDNDNDSKEQELKLQDISDKVLGLFDRIVDDDDDKKENKRDRGDDD